MKVGRKFYVPAEYDSLIYFRPIGNSAESPFRNAFVSKRFKTKYFAVQGKYVTSIPDRKSGMVKVIERVVLDPNYVAPTLPADQKPRRITLADIAPKSWLIDDDKDYTPAKEPTDFSGKAFTAATAFYAGGLADF